MSKHPLHSDSSTQSSGPEGEGFVEREGQSRRDEGSTWTRTSQDRAQEGVSPDAREQLPVEESRLEVSFGWDPSVGTAPWSPVQAGQGYDPWAHVRHDVYGQQTRESYYSYDYHYYDENYLRDEYYHHEYGTYDHVYEAPRQAPYSGYHEYVPSHWPEYHGSYGHEQRHGQDHRQDNPAASFTDPASSLVAAAFAAHAHVQPEENAHARASEYVPDSSDSYRRSAHSREEGASSLVSESQASAVLGGAPVVAGQAYAAEAPSVSSCGSAASAILPDHMSAEQAQALHTYLNGTGAPYEHAASTGEQTLNSSVHQAIYSSHDSEKRLTGNRIAESQFIVNRTIEDPHLGGAQATAQAMVHGGEHGTTSSLLSAPAVAAPHGSSRPAHDSSRIDESGRMPDILSAPSSETVREASHAAENMPWMENGPFWAAEVGAGRMLVQDMGPKAADGRFAWAVGATEGGSQLKGFGDTLEDAKAAAILQAGVHGYVSESDLHAIQNGLDPSSLRSTHAPATAGERSGSLGGLLVEPEDKRCLAEGFLFAPEAKPDGPDAKDLLASGSTAEALLLESGASASGSPAPDRADERSESKLKKAGAVAGAATLGALGFAGRAAVGAGKAALSVADLLMDQSLREDEDLKRVADGKDIARDAVINVKKHMPAQSRESAASKLLKAETLAEGALSEDGTKAGILGSRGKSEPLESEELLSKLRGEKAAPSKGGDSGKGPSEKARKRSETEKLLLDDEKEGAPKKEKKPVTQRERDLEKKKAERLLAKKDGKGDSKALSVVEKGGKLGAKGALLAGGIAASSAKKVVASKDENIAVAMSMVDKGKKAVRGARSIAKLPMRIYHVGKAVVSAVVSAVKATWHGLVSLATAGSGAWMAVGGVLFLIIAVVVILLGMLTIVNEDQELSEITALVAELDADLTEEINEMGASPVLYANAEGTYGMENDDGESATINADLRDGESDLKEVTAGSITVQTNAEAVAAYIDAKYSGEWQVGAASWKYTVDAFGKSWNLIEWDDMPEWARNALNATDQITFGFLLQETLKYYVDDVVGVDDLELSNQVAKEISQEMTRLIYGEQIQGITEEVITEVVKKSVKKHRDDLDITDDQARQIYYHMNEIITEIMGEHEPVALVYDEVVALHEKLNFWSENYKQFEDASGSGGGALLPSLGASGTSNKYGYPNSRGYNEAELAKWDGYNEISVYGVSEAGTTAVTADGTRITNTWADTNMAIACEGLQNDLFAYWTAGYKAATGGAGAGPVKITLYNPETGATVTAEVRDCGGWRGFNPSYAGMNADRQWDVLPAVWKALGGGTVAGTMHVYWKVDPNATVGGGAWVPDPITIEDYPWKDETDEGDGEIEITRPTYIAHGVHDLLNNDSLLDEIMNKDSYPTEAEYRAVKTLVIGKVQGVMKELLTMENSEGDTYIDYLYLRRNLGDPFGKDESGDPVQWVVTHRFNPGYEDFEHDDAYVEVKPLADTKTVKAVRKGVVEEVDDGKVVIRSEIDTANSAKIEYSDLTDIKVEEGDEVKKGTVLGKMDGSKLRISYYEINDAALQIETEKDWAYNPALFMQGFAGYQKPKEPEEYVGPSASRSLADCESIVDFAYSRLGCPYIWGATGPSTFDCSGLTQWCYARVGISIPRNSEQQHDAAAAAGNAHPINEAEMQPGDILWKQGHVGIYIGNNQYIHAPQTGDVVKVSTGVSYFSHYLRFAK